MPHAFELHYIRILFVLLGICIRKIVCLRWEKNYVHISRKKHHLNIGIYISYFFTMRFY